MDLGLTLGLLSAFQACRRLIVGGLLWLGCPCSSWVWVSRGSTRRCRLRPKGDTKVRSVKQANRLVRRLCYLLLACLEYTNWKTEFLISKPWFCFVIGSCPWKCICRNFPSWIHPRLEYVKKKKVYWCLEQPASSLLPLYGPLEVGFQVLGYLFYPTGLREWIVYRCGALTGPFSNPWCKWSVSKRVPIFYIHVRPAVTLWCVSSLSWPSNTTHPET